MDLEEKNITVNLIHSKTLNKEEIEELNNFCFKNKITIIESSKHCSIINGNVKTINDNFYYDKNNDIIIPNELNFINNVIGLNDKSSNKPYLRKRDSKNIKKKISFVDPKKLGSYYGIPTKYKNINLTGKGQTIGIIELGGGYNMSDLNKYFSDLGISTNRKITSIFVDGATNDILDRDSSTEVVLDIEVAGTLAYEANIVVYFGQNSFQGFYNVLRRAIYDNVNKPSIISISWGAPESVWSNRDMKSYDALFSYAVSKNINIYAASGDNGSTDGVYGRLVVDFPGSSPNVISCGGTTINDLSNKNSEVVWNNNNGWATGGGYSNMFSRPAYQNSLKLKSRGVPDVCGNADPNSGYRIYLYGSYITVGGTSAVSPLWASINALLNQANNGNSIGFINRKLYLNPSVMKDITIGNNNTNTLTKGTYNAVKGWDPTTGLGSINGQSLFNLYKF